MRSSDGARAAPPAQLPLSDADWHCSTTPPLLPLSRLFRRSKRGSSHRARRDLELDLGFDSLERVELLTELEQRFGVKLMTAAEILPFVSGRALREIDNLQVCRRKVWRPMGSDSPRASPTDWLCASDFCRACVWVFLPSADVIRARACGGVASCRDRGPNITPNHQSYVDPFVLFSVLRIARSKRFPVGAPDISNAVYAMGRADNNLVPVDPDSNLVPASRRAPSASRTARSWCFPGRAVGRRHGEEVQEGAPILAQHLGVPVVPWR